MARYMGMCTDIIMTKCICIFYMAVHSAERITLVMNCKKHKFIIIIVIIIVFMMMLLP